MPFGGISSGEINVQLFLRDTKQLNQVPVIRVRVAILVDLGDLMPSPGECSIVHPAEDSRSVDFGFSPLVSIIYVSLLASAVSRPE
jgi:hypothetical protein